MSSIAMTSDAPWPTGAWARVSVTVEGSEPTEVSDVWWLVAGSTFADFRLQRTTGRTTLPFSVTQAFAGTFTFDGPSEQMRWHHIVDTVRRNGDIEGSVRPDAEDPRVMHEAGDGFTERWARLDADGSPARAHVDEGLVAVRVGPYGIAVARHGPETVAGRYQHGRAGWLLLDAIGEPPFDGDGFAELTGG